MKFSHDGRNGCPRGNGGEVRDPAGLRRMAALKGSINYLPYDERRQDEPNKTLKEE